MTQPEDGAETTATYGLRHLVLRGPDGENHEYITTSEAEGVIGKHRRRLQAACNAYWQRITAEEAAAASHPGTTVDYTPRPQELACIKIASTHRTMQALVRVDTIPLHFVNRPREDGSRQLGNLPGWRRDATKPYNYRPREEDKRYRATRERLARLAAEQGHAPKAANAANGAGTFAAPETPDAMGRTPARKRRRNGAGDGNDAGDDA